MSSNIYHDQENRLVQNRRLKREERVQNTIAITNKNEHLTNKRTVLSTLNINSNLRVQPSRAAKQGVCYESGAPQHQQQQHSFTNQSYSSNDSSSRSRSSVSSNFPSSQNSTLGSIDVPPALPFTIYQDPSSILGGSSSQVVPTASKTKENASCSTSLPAQVGRKTGSSQSISLTTSKVQSLGGVSLPSVPSVTSVAALQPKVYPPHKENKENVSCRPSARKVPRKSSPQCLLQSPEAMDISMSENFLMAVDTPMVPGEDILQSRQEDIYEVPEYATEIYAYLRNAETCHKARVNYMAKQNDITSGMRWILVDWLVEVAEEYELHSETLFLAVSYVDRFLSQMSVKRDKLQLVGTTAMFIAAKYEEIYPPDVGQFAYITDNTYKKSQILRMEHLILKVLSFDMAVPTAYLFVNRFARLCNCNKEATHLSYFLVELSMLDCDPFLRYLPSMIAASSVALANYTLGKPTWPEDVAKFTQYALTDLKECYINLNTSFTRVHEPSQHAIRDKYKASKWNAVSNLSPREGFPWS